jgi:glycogen operon protein
MSNERGGIFMNAWERIEGAPQPLGVTYAASEEVYNFAVYSKHAAEVVLHLFSENDLVNPVYSYTCLPLKNKSGRVWHCCVPKSLADKAVFYGYQVRGPSSWEESGHRFDPEKILLDPYATSVYFPPRYDPNASNSPGSNRDKAPLGLISQNVSGFDWGHDLSPRHAHDAIVYELHVRGFTKRSNSGVAHNKEGTFAGLTKKIPYLKDLGVTVVELLPVFQFEPLFGNYWGYMPLSFFAVHNAYAHDKRLGAEMDEFREMVKAFHQAGIEIVLDVVYNHTAEGGYGGPTYSFRGIDNTTYYLLNDQRNSYLNYSGCGNTLNTNNRYVRSMIVDSLRYWVEEMHVDGFRFDIATIFTLMPDARINLEDPPVVQGISSDPYVKNGRLIAEAWGGAGYQLGRTFPGILWSQWNGKFRDEVRCFVKGDPGYAGKLANRLYGSCDDLFSDSVITACRPFQSINFINCHDGYCLCDLVSYNSDTSWDCINPGESNASPATMALRKRQVKNLCALLMLANGVPMFCAGDEFMNTQKGNNNPYNQDNETTWLDWHLLEQNKDVFRFFKIMIAFRKSHPSLRRAAIWRDDVHWYGIGREPDWSPIARTLAFCLHGAAEKDQDIYVMINAYWEDLDFNIQEGGAQDWWRVVDTSFESPHDIKEAGNEAPLRNMTYSVKGRSVVVLLRK